MQRADHAGSGSVRGRQTSDAWVAAAWRQPPVTSTPQAAHRAYVACVLFHDEHIQAAGAPSSAPSPLPTLPVQRRPPGRPVERTIHCTGSPALSARLHTAARQTCRPWRVVRPAGPGRAARPAASGRPAAWRRAAAGGGGTSARQPWAAAPPPPPACGLAAAVRLWLV